MGQESSWCPNCGAPVELSPDTVVLVCGYCGTAVLLSGVRLEPFMMVCEDGGVVRGVLERFVRERAGGGVLRDVKYLFVPFWVVEVEAVTRYNGYSEKRRYSNKSSYTEYRPVRGTIRERSAVAVYGRRFEGLFGLGQVKSVLLSRLEAAKPLDAERARGWTVIGSELEDWEAMEAAKSRVAEEHRRRVEQMATKGFDCYTEAVVKSTKLILYPVVEARYESGGKSYRVCMDGVKGAVRPLTAEMPVTRWGRVARAVASVAAVLALSLAAVVLQQAVFIEWLPDEARLAAIVVPPLLAVAAGAYGAYTATQEQRVMRSAGEGDILVLGGL